MDGGRRNHIGVCADWVNLTDRCSCIGKEDIMDKAFEAERVKYRQKVRELESANRKQAETEYSLREELRQANTKIREQDEWIDRLCEHIDITREEFMASMKAKQSVSNLFGIMGAIGRGFGL